VDIYQNLLFWSPGIALISVLLIALHFYFRRTVKTVLKDNSYFVQEILDEIERRGRVRTEVFQVRHALEHLDKGKLDELDKL
jgi:hypothetical protein